MQRHTDIRYEGALEKLSPHHPVFKHRVLKLRGTQLEYRKTANGATTGSISLDNARAELVDDGQRIVLHTPEDEAPYQLRAASVPETRAWFSHIQASIQDVSSGKLQPQVPLLQVQAQ